MRRALEIGETVSEGRHTLALIGELDLASADELEAAILPACADGTEEVVLDLSELVFVDSTGLRAIMASKSICEEQGCDFVLMHVRDQVERLFELTGFAQKLRPQKDAEI
jgi:anti-sigma B factor antagonist